MGWALHSPSLLSRPFCTILPRMYSRDLSQSFGLPVKYMFSLCTENRACFLEPLGVFCCLFPYLGCVIKGRPSLFDTAFLLSRFVCLPLCHRRKDGIAERLPMSRLLLLAFLSHLLFSIQFLPCFKLLCAVCSGLDTSQASPLQDFFSKGLDFFF